MDWDIFPNIVLWVNFPGDPYPIHIDDFYAVAPWHFE